MVHYVIVKLINMEFQRVTVTLCNALVVLQNHQNLCVCVQIQNVIMLILIKVCRVVMVVVRMYIHQHLVYAICNVKEDTQDTEQKIRSWK